MIKILLFFMLFLLVFSCGEVISQNQTCGNGVIENSEECDDGNIFGGDGCSPGCTIERAILGEDYSQITPLSYAPMNLCDTNTETYNVLDVRICVVRHLTMEGMGASEQHVINIFNDAKRFYNNTNINLILSSIIHHNGNYRKVVTDTQFYDLLRGSIRDHAQRGNSCDVVVGFVEKIQGETANGGFWSAAGKATFPQDYNSIDGHGFLIKDNVGPHVFAHELGHVLGLWHTHEGGDNPYSNYGGDMCNDTAFDPYEGMCRMNLSANRCEEFERAGCVYECGANGECNEDEKAFPPVYNIMSYYEACQKYPNNKSFTRDQINRMRCFIPHITNTTIDPNRCGRGYCNPSTHTCNHSTNMCEPIHEDPNRCGRGYCNPSTHICNHSTNICEPIDNGSQEPTCGSICCSSLTSTQLDNLPSFIFLFAIFSIFFIKRREKEKAEITK